MIPKVSSFFYNLSKITLAATGILFSNYLIAQPGFVANQGSRAAHGESTSEKLDTSSFKVTLPKELKELLTAKQQADLIKALKFQAEQESKHPYHTNTAKSISSPAAVPMMWGGIGIGGAVWNRYPTATKNSWSGNGVIALPIGNSDK